MHSRAIGSSPDSDQNSSAVKKIGSCNILAYILVYFSNFDPVKALSRCRVDCVSKMRFYFICKIFQLKMLIMVITFLQSISAAKVTVAKNRIQSTHT